MERDYLEQGTQKKQIEFRKKCSIKIFYGQIMGFYLQVFVTREKRSKIWLLKLMKLHMKYFCDLIRFKIILFLKKENSIVM